MRLYYGPTSPYARKVRIAIIELGLSNRIELVKTNPFGDDPDFLSANPLAKVPALQLDDKTVLFDSRVILEYLDALPDTPRIIPVELPQRWQILRLQALGDGLLDAAFSIVMERKRTDAEQSDYWLERWKNAINRSLEVFENQTASFTPSVDIAQITVAACLGYLDLRLGDMGWRAAFPASASWFDKFSLRPSIKQTHPDL